MSTTYKQDMPPPGGYQSFDFFRRAQVKPLKGLYILAFLYVNLGVGIYFYRNFKRNMKQKYSDNNELRIALSPFLIAESQRDYLKHVSKTRDAERELMGDVPEWETGKWFNYPLFHNPRKLWIQTSSTEYFGQMLPKDQYDYQSYHHWIL